MSKRFSVIKSNKHLVVWRVLVIAIFTIMVWTIPASPQGQPVLHYPFDEGSGTVVGDASSNGFDGTINGGAVWQTGISNTGLLFDGVDDYVSAGDVLDNVFAGTDKQFSLSIWAKPLSVMTDNTLINKTADSSCSQGNRQFWFNIKTDSKPVFIWFGGLNVASVRSVFGSTPITDTNKWYHLVVTYDGTVNANNGLDRVTMYVDGVQEVTSLEAIGSLGDIEAGAAPVGIGGSVHPDESQCGNYNFHGLLDDARVYGRLLSASEVSTLYSDFVSPVPDFSHIGDTDPETEGWTLNQGIGTLKGPINDGGTPAWFTDDNSTADFSFVQYFQIPTDSQIATGNTSGWKLRANVRVVDSTFLNGAVSLSYRDKSRSWQLHFAVEADGDPIVQAVTGFDPQTGAVLGPTFTLQGAGSGYNLYELRYDTVAGNVDLFANGVEQVSDYVGFDITVFPNSPQVGVFFGSGDSGSTGQANWNLVAFEIQPSPSSPTVLFGVTDTDLVTIDPLNPSNVTVVGSFGLPAKFTAINGLAYNPVADSLLGFAQESDFSGSLVSFDRTTGSATVLADLGKSSVVGVYEAIEYVSSLNSLVVSHEIDFLTFITKELLILNTDGSTTFQALTTLDNDYGVYDSTNGKFYTTDPNGIGQFVEVNLTNGSHSNLGAIPSTLGELTFNATDGNIYGVDYNNNDLYSISTTQGGSPISFSQIGTVAGGQIRGLAFASPQQPTFKIITTTLPNGSTGVSYSPTLQATGGTLPYTWDITVGTLPNGLSFDSSTGVISGTPTGEGTFNITVQVTDANGQTATQSLSIVVDSVANPFNGPAGANYPQLAAQDPVNTGTGNYAYQRLDLIMPGRGMPLIFQRTYNNQDTYDGPLGHGWTHSYNIFLTVNPDNSVTVKWGDGHENLFNDSGGGNYTPRDAGVFDTLVKNADNTFTLTQKNQTQYQFDSAGTLTAILEQNGNTLNFGYDVSGNLTTITDTVGRVVALIYDGNNRITQLTDPLGRTVGYSYDANGDLTTVTDPSGQTTTFAYDVSHQVTQIVLPDGNDLLQNTYDAQGRVVSQQNGRGDGWLFSYDTPGARQTTITDPLSNTTVHTYDSQIRIIDETDANGNSISYTYDTDNNRTSITDKNGNTTQFGYDTVGNLTQITDPLSNTIGFTYDSNNNLTDATDANGNITTFGYDGNNNLSTITDALGNLTTLNYNASGELVSRTNALGKTTTYTYDANSNITQITNALGNASNLTYDGIGRLLSLTDANGSNVSASYDTNSRLTQITDPLGNQTAFAYDAVGNLTQITDANGNTTQYAYDAVTNLTNVTDEAGNLTSYSYSVNQKSPTTRWATD